MKESASHYFDPRKIEFVNELHGKDSRFNPRTLNNPGFTPANMKKLRAGICRDGLNHAILVWLNAKGVPQLIAGERRLRTILSMLEDDEQAKKIIDSGGNAERVMCKNPRTKKMEPALVVYGEYGVECKITDSKDEKEMLRQAIQENTLHEGLTDYELLLQCKNMEEAGISRADQAETMGVSEAWISQSHSLLEADEHLLACMERQQLTRTAALTFLNVPKDKVRSVLHRAIDLTYADAEKKEIQAIEDVKEAEKEIEIGNANLSFAKLTGNQSSANKARRQIARAGKMKTKAEEKVEKTKEIKENHGNKITIETIKIAAKDVDAAENLGQPQATKNIRVIADQISECLKSEDGNTLVFNDKTYKREEVDLVYGVLRWVLNRNHCEHPLDVLKVA